MIKVVSPSSFGFDQQVMSLVDVHSRGVDQSWLKKSAAVLTKELADIRPEPGITFVHLLALGDQETYGLNRNGDGFPKHANESKHGTFVKHAKWFHNHKNKPHKGDPDYGYVKYSAYNPDMHRVELVVGIDEKKDPDSIQKLARGEDIPVSMACVLDPDYPVLTIQGYKPISQMTTGDEVYTHQGRWRKVKAINRRKYTGAACKFHMNGLPGTLALTSDHPMFATVFRSQHAYAGSLHPDYVKQKATRYFKDSAAFNANPPSWIHAEHVEVGDRFFYAPIAKYPGYAAIADTDLAALMGYYIAEGSLSFNADKACTVMYTINMGDSALRRIPNIVAQVYPDITCKIETHRNSKVCVNVSVFNTEFAEYMNRLVGRGCGNKKVCPELFNANAEVKLAFIGAWLDADGFVDSKGMHWSMSSRYLALQLRDLLVSIGIPASIYMIDHEKCATSGMPGSGDEYTVNVSHIERMPFMKWADKALNYSEPPKEQNDKLRSAAVRQCDNGLYAYRVATVEKYSVDNATTYNIEVEEDESYSLGGFISHNCTVPHDTCTVCKHQAKTASEYCKCIKEACTQMTEDGTQIGMINDDPTFFDISKVHRNADRIAFSLRKVASHDSVILSTELARMYGITEPTMMVKNSEYRGQLALLEKLAKLEKEIDGEIKANPSMQLVADGLNEPVSAELGKIPEDKIPSALGKLASDSVILPMADFFKMAMGPRFAEIEKDLPAAQACLPTVFAGAVKSAEEFLSGVPNYKPVDAALPVLIKNILTKVGQQARLTGGSVQSRIMGNTLRKTASVFVPNKSLQATTQIGRILATEYARYKLAALYRVEDPSVVKLAVLQDFGH